MDAAEVVRIAEQSLAVKRAFFSDNAGRLVQAGERVAGALRAGGRLLVFGNGGSAADAQHFAGELVGRFRRERRALPALALTTDASVMTALGNDLGFESVFRRQLEAHGRPGDVAFAISTSGRSPNVVEAVRWARDHGLLTVGLTGGGGGALAGLVELLIDVPDRDTQRIQEVHGMVIHLLCQVLEEALAA